MKKIMATVASALVLATATPAFAQQADAASTAAAQELFESMNYRAVMVDMMRQMSQGAVEQLHPMLEAAINRETKLSAAQRKEALAKIDKKLPQIRQLMLDFMNDPALIDDLLATVVPAYARHFTADEIRQLAAFYRTPLGAKMLAVMPKLAGESMQLSQQLVFKRMEPLMQKLVQVLQD